MSDYGRLQEENGQLKAENERLKAVIAEMKADTNAGPASIDSGAGAHSLTGPNGPLRAGDIQPGDVVEFSIATPEGNEQSDA